MRVKNVLGIAFLIMLAAGAQPAIGAFWQWSKTATNNATADPSINWSEGMSPSSVNDSARAMMARLAEQGADTSGALTLAGGPVAYTATTNQGFQTPTPVDGQLIAFTANVANGANATLAVDGGNAYAIQANPGIALPAASFVAGSPYTAKFSLSNSSWLIRNYFASPAVVPLGALIPFTGTVSPGSNFIFAAGQCISTTTYNAYWVLLGSPVPGTCGAGTFKVIDMSGNVPAGLDTMPGFSAAGRLTSAATGCGISMTAVGTMCTNGNEGHLLAVAEVPSHYHSIGWSDPGHSHTIPLTFGGTAAGSPGLAGGAAGSTGTSTNGTGITFTGAGGANTTGAVGGGTKLPIVQPTVGVTYLIRVL